MDAVGVLSRTLVSSGLAIEASVDMFTFYVAHSDVYGAEWIFFSSRGRHTSFQGDWSSDVCSSDLESRGPPPTPPPCRAPRRQRPGLEIPAASPVVESVSFRASRARRRRHKTPAAPCSRMPHGKIGRASCRERV